MIRKVGKIMWNSIKTLRINEIMCLFVTPLFVIVPIFLGINSYIINNKEFVNDFIDKVITITTLLSAFGLAALSILVSSSSKNIEDSKNLKCSNRRRVNGKEISYYQLQFYRSISGLIIQFIVLILSIIFNFIFLICNNTCMLLLFYSIFYLLIVSLLFQILSIISIYYLFVNTDRNDDN